MLAAAQAGADESSQYSVCMEFSDQPYVSYNPDQYLIDYNI